MICLRELIRGWTAEALLVGRLTSLDRLCYRSVPIISVLSIVASQMQYLPLSFYLESLIVLGVGLDCNSLPEVNDMNFVLGDLAVSEVALLYRHVVLGRISFKSSSLPHKALLQEFRLIKSEHSSIA